jgi:hypothetical protein
LAANIPVSILLTNFRLSDVPETFYMREPYKSQPGPINLEDLEINNEYDAFKLFFDKEIYELIIKYTQEKNYNNYLNEVYSYCHGYLR